MTTQAITFSIIHGWTPKLAEAWLKKNHYKSIKKVHRSGTLLRYRLRQPTFLHYITKKTREGINFIIGFRGR